MNPEMKALVKAIETERARLTVFFSETASFAERGHASMLTAEEARQVTVLNRYLLALFALTEAVPTK